MRRFLYVLIGISLISGIAFLIRGLEMNDNSLKDIQSYRIYYGPIVDDYINEYGNYDLLILESLHHTKEEIYALNYQTDTLVYGYLSVFEVPNWRLDLVDQVPEDAYMFIDNEPLRNEEYNNDIGDIRHEAYRAILIKEIEENIINKGFDGVFLDTIDWIDYLAESDDYDSILTGYLTFLSEVKETYPDLGIIQNRSFKAYKDGSNQYINGFLWEDFTDEDFYNHYLQWSAILIKQQLLADQKIFVVSHEDDDKKNSDLAKKMKWVFFLNKNDYTQW